MNALSKAEMVEWLSLAEEQERRQANTRYLSAYNSFYDWQREFCAATATYHESCLCAANQIGKTYLGTDIDAFHLMGDYPDDYPGHRFDFPPLMWGLGYSMEKTRDLLQSALFGELRDGTFSGGLIPADRIHSYQSATGTSGACRTVKVKHKYGISTVQFWSYTQGQHAMMGDVVDWVHIDEEPEDQTIRPQVLTRTINGDKGKGGRIIYTLTPENGKTELILQFMETPTDSQFFMQKGWDDAPHMTEEKKARLLEAYPSYQKDMRSKGDPILGHGRIFEVDEEFITCDPFEIPAHWAVINGMDFGWDHPQAHIQMAWDQDNDIIYLTKAWKGSKLSANDAYGVVKEWGVGIPTAWPHDGLQHEKGRDDSVQQKVHYQKAGFKMLPDHATWPNVMRDGKQVGGGNSVEQGIYELNDRMRKGKFQAFGGLTEFFNEYRQYHRNDKSRIVKSYDDILDAVRYGYMMRRFAVKVGELTAPTQAYIPRPIKALR